MVKLKTTYQKLSFAVAHYDKGINGNKTLEELKLVYKGIRRLQEDTMNDIEKAMNEKRQEYSAFLESNGPLEKDSVDEKTKKSIASTKKQEALTEDLNKFSEEELSIELPNDIIIELKNTILGIKPNNFDDKDFRPGMASKAIVLRMLSEVGEDLEKAAEGLEVKKAVEVPKKEDAK